MTILKKNLADNIKSFYFVFQSTFMNNIHQQPQQDLHHIKQMMERSSRFISLSGLSGIAAGITALVGAYFANTVISKATQQPTHDALYNRNATPENYLSLKDYMGSKLFFIAVVTFIISVGLAFLFTYLRSKKTNTPIWGASSKRLIISVAVPMCAGGFYLLKLMEAQAFGLIAPGCLIFYGLALVNAAKYTLGEIKYLGYLQIILGIMACWFTGYGLYFWAVGFGILHIIYGIIMWNKYERE